TAIAATSTETATNHPAEPLPQVEGLAGDLQVDSGALWLRWSPYTGSADQLRLYRSARNDEPLETSRVLMAELPVDATAYQETTPLCDHAYVLVAVDRASDGEERESLPSTSTYYTPSCADD